MLVIRVELHSAVTGKVTEIARMLMHNDGTGTPNRGNYKAKTVKGKIADNMPAMEIRDSVPLREGEVKDYPRLGLHVWHLVCRMLKSMDYK